MTDLEEATLRLREAINILEHPKHVGCRMEAMERIDDARTLLELPSEDPEKSGVPCEICGGTGVLGECIGICEPPDQATHLNPAAVPQCDNCDPEWRDR